MNALESWQACYSGGTSSSPSGVRLSKMLTLEESFSGEKRAPILRCATADLREDAKPTTRTGTLRGGGWLGNEQRYSRSAWQISSV